MSSENKNDTETDGITVEEYFTKAFELGKQNHKFIQTLRQFYRNTYAKVEAEFLKNQKIVK